MPTKFDCHKKKCTQILDMYEKTNISVFFYLEMLRYIKKDLSTILLLKVFNMTVSDFHDNHTD